MEQIKDRIIVALGNLYAALAKLVERLQNDAGSRVDLDDDLDNDDNDIADPFSLGGDGVDARGDRSGGGRDDESARRRRRQRPSSQPPFPPGPPGSHEGGSKGGYY